MGDLKLAGTLNLTGTLNLSGRDGGKVKVNDHEVLVETTKGQGVNQGSALTPVPIPPPPLPPSDPGLSTWVFNSFNKTITANGKRIVTQGMCVQGSPGTAKWPGMIQQSLVNAHVTINSCPINVVGDTGTALTTGATIIINSSGQ